MLGVENMRRHTADAGWQLTKGLGEAGYTLCGLALEVDETKVPVILQRTQPGTVLIQDVREWDPILGSRRGFRPPEAMFTEIKQLGRRFDLFKLTVIKDAHHRPPFHAKWDKQHGIHAWVVYYHPRIVEHVSGYSRPEYYVRTYHTLNPSAVPPPRKAANVLLSGAHGKAYPLRRRLWKHQDKLPMVTIASHPGYRVSKCVTPNYLKKLSKFKVAICTSSVFGFALRKIIEATACACVVVTDLPTDEVLPEIDENLVRVDPDISFEDLGELLKQLCNDYNLERQQEIAQRAKQFYDYRRITAKLAADIEQLRQRYNDEQ